MNYEEKIDVLFEVLPYVNKFHKEIVVIKYGGHAMVNNKLQESVMHDILLLHSVGIFPVIVHGGGPYINRMLDLMNIKSHFEQGLRVTDKKTMEVVELVLNGQVNGEIVNHYNRLGGSAMGLSGKDGNLIKVQKKRLYDDKGYEIDLGYVGEVTEVDGPLLVKFLDSGYVPIISSIGVDEKGDAYNINADYVAAAVASALSAKKLILLTDIKGILRDMDDESSLITRLTVDEINDLMEEGILSGGMVPKVECCVSALNQGVDQVHIIDGRVPHSLLSEIFFDAGIGTMITLNKGEFAND